MLNAYIENEMNIPLVGVPVVTQRISDTDLSSIDSVSATVLSVGDFYIVDFVDCSEVHSPPGFVITLCVRNGPLVPVAGTIPINSILSLSRSI